MLKRKLFTLALTIIFVFSCLSGTAVFALASSSSIKGVTSYGTTDFEDANTIADFKAEGNANVTVVADPADASNKVLKYAANKSGVYKRDGLNIGSDYLEISFDFYQDADYERTNAADFIRYKDGGWKNFMDISAKNEMNVLHGSSTKNTVSPNKWYGIKKIFDFSQKKVVTYFGEKGDLKYIGETNLGGAITDLQFLYPDQDFYMDNFTFNQFNLKNPIAASETAQDVKNALDFYHSNNIAKTNYIFLDDAAKTDVAQKMLADKASYADDAAVLSAINNIVAMYGDGSVVYYKWDFSETKSINDLVNGTQFMMDNKNANGEGTVTIVNDASISSNSILKLDLTKPGEKLTNTTNLKNDISKLKYVVYTMDAYHDKSTQVAIASRNADASRNNLFTVFTGSVNQWLSYKTVVDLNSQKIMRFNVDNGVNTEPAKDNFTKFEGNDFRINNIGEQFGNFYLKNFEIRGYEDFYTEVNNASETNVLKVVDAFKNMQVITLPAQYDSMDDAAKASLAAALKSKIFTSDDEVLTLIACECSDNELVSIDDVTENNTLKSVVFAINKDGITSGSAVAVFASYDADKTLIDVKTVALSNTSFAKYNKISVSDIGLNVSGSQTVKYMLLDDLSTLKPFTVSLVK